MQLNMRMRFTASVLMLCASAASAQSGYTVVMRSASGQNQGTATLKMAGDKMRLETDVGGMMGRGGGGGNAAMAAGAYILPNAAGKVTIVLPNAPNMMGGGGTGMAMAMDFSMLGGRGRGAAAPVEDLTVQDMGAGETIAGHATHRYKLSAQSGSVTEVWLATDVAGLDYKRFAGSFGNQLSFGGDALAGKLPGSGFPMKVVSTKDGTTNTMEVTQLDKTTFEPSIFEVPAGLQVLDMGAMMGGRRGGGN